jgi:hypothetical protein
MTVSRIRAGLLPGLDERADEVTAVRAAPGAVRGDDAVDRGAQVGEGAGGRRRALFTGRAKVRREDVLEGGGDPVRVHDAGGGAPERVRADHPQRQRGEVLLERDGPVPGPRRPAVRELRRQRGEVSEVPFVGGPSGEHREQQPPPGPVLLGVQHL